MQAISCRPRVGREDDVLFICPNAVSFASRETISVTRLCAATSYIYRSSSPAVRCQSAGNELDLIFWEREKIMKKLLALTLSLAAMGFTASTAGAITREAAHSAAAEPQRRVQIERNDRRDDRRDNQRNDQRNDWRNNRRNERRVRVVTQTRIVRRGRQIYRETYEVRYLPNGRTQTRLISRVRVR